MILLILVIAKQIFQKFKNPEITPSEIERTNSPKKQKRIEAIQSVLDNHPNTSVRIIAEETQIPATSVWRALVSDMGLNFQVPILAPHNLTYEMKQKRIEKSIELLRVLEDPKLKLHKIITGDEAWFQWTGRVSGKWQRKDDPPSFSTRIPKTIINLLLKNEYSLPIEELKNQITMLN